MGRLDKLKGLKGLKDRVGELVHAAVSDRGDPSPPAEAAAARTASGAATVIGLFARDMDADIALNNLTEADFAAETISVLTADPTRTSALTDVPGPLAAVPLDQLPATLTALGLAAGEADAYGARVAAGAVFLAIAAPAGAEAAATAMLTDQHAAAVRILTGTPSSEEGVG